MWLIKIRSLGNNRKEDKIMKNKNNLNVLKEENDKRKYFMLDIYGGYNKQELMASDIEVYAKTEKDAMKEAIKIFKDEYDYDPEENKFGLKAVITSSDLDEEIDTKELDETLPETFEGKIDFLAADEEEAIEGYDKVLLALEGDEYSNVRKQLEIIRDEEVAHKEFLEKVKTDLDTVYVDPSEEEDKEEEIVDIDTETDESLKEKIEHQPDVDYKGFTIEHFPIEWHYDDKVWDQDGYIIHSPYYLQSNSEKPKIYLPLYCEDEYGEVLNFKTLDDAKNYIDDYILAKKGKIKVKRDECHFELLPEYRKEKDESLEEECMDFAKNKFLKESYKNDLKEVQKEFLDKLIEGLSWVDFEDTLDLDDYAYNVWIDSDIYIPDDWCEDEGYDPANVPDRAVDQFFDEELWVEPFISKAEKAIQEARDMSTEEIEITESKFLKEDLEDDCREKAEEQLKNSNNFAAIYGYTTHGKFFCLPAVRLCKDEESLKANTEAVRLRYHPQGSIRVAYKNDTLEDSWKYKDHMYNALEEEDLEDILYDKRSK